jgi:heme/copper-type cytochrome/quinol oxidase subunit 3
MLMASCPNRRSLTHSYYLQVVTVTYAHHSLIQGNRSGALYGLVAIVLLAIIFTAFQGIEYTVSSFTISDGAFGSCFYFGTGFQSSLALPRADVA